MNIIRLETPETLIFEQLVDWNYNWWGKATGKSKEMVRYQLEHSLCTGNRLPQTFVALMDEKPVGMYQLSMGDDLFGRPDLYPWLINVYVDEAFRGRNICRAMMESVPMAAKQAGLSDLYLYTHHVGLYEKFGWEFAELVPTFHADSPMERLYRLQLK